jgi:hypothetical protein
MVLLSIFGRGYFRNNLINDSDLYHIKEAGIQFKAIKELYKSGELSISEVLTILDYKYIQYHFYDVKEHLIKKFPDIEDKLDNDKINELNEKDYHEEVNGNYLIVYKVLNSLIKDISNFKKELYSVNNSSIYWKKREEKCLNSETFKNNLLKEIKDEYISIINNDCFINNENEGDIVIDDNIPVKNKILYFIQKMNNKMEIIYEYLLENKENNGK